MKLCLALIWPTEIRLYLTFIPLLIVNILLTCVPERAKEHQTEHCVDEEEAAHLLLSPLVSPLVFLYRHILVVPVPVYSGDVGAGYHVDDLLEPESTLKELF